MAISIFDLVRTSAEMDLMGPDGEPLNCKLRLQSLNTANIKQKSVEAQASIMQANKTQNMEEFVKLIMRAEKSAQEIAAMAIVGWDNDEVMGGPYTPDYAKQVCADPRMDFLRAQVNTFIGEQKNFLSQPELGLKSA